MLTTAQTSMQQVNIPEVAPLQHFQQAFGNGNDPAVVAIKAADVTAPPVRAAIADLKRRALASGQMAAPIVVDSNATHTVATVEIPLNGDGTDSTSKAALRTLRSDLLPATLGRVDGVDYAVTGSTAADHDWSASMTRTAPLVFAFVLIFAFLILTAAFRSVVVATKAVLLNLLSVAAAYGILVMVFQWGWGEGVLNFHSNGGITPWLPMFLFVILFGLSMDYHVFILSRVREAYGRGLSNEDAVPTGSSRPPASSPAPPSSWSSPSRSSRRCRSSTSRRWASASRPPILIDATLIRAVLLPATMKLLGDRNWYLPRWLEWLPSLEHDETPRASVPLPVPAQPE